MNGTPEDRRKLWWDLFNLDSLINWRDCRVSPCEDKETGRAAARSYRLLWKHTWRPSMLSGDDVNMDAHLDLNIPAKGWGERASTSPLPSAIVMYFQGSWWFCSSQINVTGSFLFNGAFYGNDVKRLCEYEPRFAGALWKFTAQVWRIIFKVTFSQ